MAIILLFCSAVWNSFKLTMESRLNLCGLFYSLFDFLTPFQTFLGGGAARKYERASSGAGHTGVAKGEGGRATHQNLWLIGRTGLLQYHFGTLGLLWYFSLRLEKT